MNQTPFFSAGLRSQAGPSQLPVVGQSPCCRAWTRGRARGCSAPPQLQWAGAACAGGESLLPEIGAISQSLEPGPWRLQCCGVVLARRNQVLAKLHLTASSPASTCQANGTPDPHISPLAGKNTENLSHNVWHGYYYAQRYWKKKKKTPNPLPEQAVGMCININKSSNGLRAGSHSAESHLQLTLAWRASWNKGS